MTENHGEKELLTREEVMELLSIQKVPSDLKFKATKP